VVKSRAFFSFGGLDFIGQFHEMHKTSAKYLFTYAIRLFTTEKAYFTTILDKSFGLDLILKLN